MQHGCHRLCPKVREQLRKAREEAGEEFDEEESSSSDSILSKLDEPSNVQKIQNKEVIRSKENSRYPSGVASPKKIIETPHRSHESGRSKEYGKETPTANVGTRRKYPDEIESLGRSKGSRDEQEFISGHGSPDECRKFEPERSNHRRSQRSHLENEYFSNTRNPDVNRNFENKRSNYRRNPDRVPDESSRFERQFQKEYHSGHESPGRTPRYEIVNDPQSSNNPRSYGSERERNYPEDHRKSIERSHGSPRNGNQQPEEYRSGNSSKTKQCRDAYDLAKHEKSKGTLKSDDEEAAHTSGIAKDSRRRKLVLKAKNIRNDKVLCDPHCKGRNEHTEKLMGESNEKAIGECILNRGISYFDDVCGCCVRCLTNQLWKDSFVKSTVISVALFALGVKLCSELDGWSASNLFE